ncbi:MAG: PqqD family protein [Acidobacteria bacterium]|nr:PqqD family protein [Acidobacteriota bacterium]
MRPRRLNRADRAVDLLELEPVRCVPWREGEDGRVVIDRPRPSLRGLRGLLDGLTWLLAPRRIRLDEVGSFAWRRLDGATKVSSLAGVMCDVFPDARDQLEERLGQYLRALRRLRVISFPEWDEPRS